MKNLSSVIVHENFDKYLKINLDITSKNNHVYLIGNQELNSLESEKITFVDINKYRNLDSVNKVKDNFINYGAKDNKTEIFWYSRILMINEFMKEYNLNSVFNIDSDNILLGDINKYPFKEDNALCISKNWHEHYLTASIHSGLITQQFCEEYEKLYFDLFINKSKYNLIEGKVEFHKSNPGGIADMTVYYLLYSQKIIKIQNLLEPVDFEGSKSVFINNISSEEGFDFQDQYLKNKKYLKIVKKDGGNFVYDIKNDEYLNLLNIHFQGKAKKKMNNLLKFKLSY